MRILVSACLLGCPCRYDGASKAHPAVLALAEQLRAVSPAGTQVLVTGLSPIIGAHTGPGALTVCHFGTGRMG